MLIYTAIAINTNTDSDKGSMLLAIDVEKSFTAAKPVIFGWDVIKNNVSIANSDKAMNVALFFGSFPSFSR